MRKFVALAGSTLRAGRVTRRARTILLSAMLAAIVTGGGAAAQSAAKPNKELRQACASDVRTLCADIVPGAGRIKQCMVEKRDRLSDGCKRAMEAARGSSGQ